MPFQNFLNQEIKNLCQSFDPSLDYIQKFLSLPGKQFRPQLYLDLISLFRKPEQADYQIAVGLELLHLFFLVHDDIMDGDELRRGEQTIHFYFQKKYGTLKAQGIALIIGDLLFSKSMELIFTNCKSNHSAAVLFEAVNKTARGQLDEYILDPSNFQQIKVEKLLAYYQEKTALYSVYLPLGLAYLNTSNNFNFALEDLKTFSSNLGVAFQIRDDLIEYTGEKARNNQSLSADIVRGKLTPILLYIIQNSPSVELKNWLNEWKSGSLSKSSHDQIFTNGNQLNVVDYTKKLIDHHYQLAHDFASKSQLKSMPSLQAVFKMMN